MKSLVQRQYRQRVAETKALRNLVIPAEGWVRTVRKAFGMSLAQLGQRMGLTASAVSRMERYEPEGRVTLQQLEKAAQALHCRVVYALVPEKDVEELVSDQAMRKAEALVRKVDTTMALEDQQLSEEELNYKIAERAARYLEKPPKDFWVDDE